MPVTYPANPAKPYGDHIEAPGADVKHDEPFVPVYARRGGARGGRSKIKTWMILTPVAVLVLGGIGAMLVTAPEEAAVPLAESARNQAPAATPRVVTPAPAAPTGPQAYTPAPAAPAPTPPPPIIVEPIS